MGRPLSKQQLFGANEKNNIKVQFFNGTASVPGFIVEQTGSKRFVCQDADGIRRTCYLVDKASADLAYKEMTITLKYDDGTVVHATKIARHRFSSVDGKTFSAPWNFSTSITDSVWQIEEAGTDDQLTDATDLEGDGFSTLADYPAPDSGTVTQVSYAIGAVSYVEQLEVIEPANSKNNSEVAGYASGLRRQKYDGNFSVSGSMNDPATWDYTFFTGQTVPPLGEIADTKINFGDQEDLLITGGNHFSLQWVGYIKAPSAGNWNFYAKSDDQVGIWTGADAVSVLAGTGGSAENLLAYAGGSLGGGFIVAGHNGGRYTVTMSADTWYPIVIWFGEFGGNCTCEIFAQKSDGTKLAMKDFAFKYNPASLGL